MVSVRPAIRARTVSKRIVLAERAIAALMVTIGIVSGASYLSVARGSVADAERTIIVGTLVLIIVLLAYGTLVIKSERARRQRRRRASAERERELREVSELAFHDQLTGLQNRASFMLSFAQALDRAERASQMLACLFVDLDGFKTVNDTLGHQAGDRVLYAVAKNLRKSVRKSDIVARIGGDEFVLLLPTAARPSDAILVAEKLLRAVHQPIDVGAEFAARVSASIGISFFPKDGMDAATLLQAADDTMYVAKNKGKARYAVHESVEAAPTGR